MINDNVELYYFKGQKNFIGITTPHTLKFRKNKFLYVGRPLMSTASVDVPSFYVVGHQA